MPNPWFLCLLVGLAAPSVMGGEADKYAEVKELPVQLKNIVSNKELVEKQLTQFEADARSGEIDKSSLWSTRVTLQSVYGDIQAASESDVAYKNHPVLKELRSSYLGVQKRMAQLEKEYLGCTWGMQMSDKTVKPPSMEWSYDDFKALRNKAKHKTVRCWLIKDPESYVF